MLKPASGNNHCLVPVILKLEHIANFPVFSFGALTSIRNRGI